MTRSGEAWREKQSRGGGGWGKVRVMFVIYVYDVTRSCDMIRRGAAWRER